MKVDETVSVKVGEVAKATDDKLRYAEDSRQRDMEQVGAKIEDKAEASQVALDMGSLREELHAMLRPSSHKQVP